MNVLNVAVTGYYGTGSSAVIDLLREYEGVKVVPDIGNLYEHEIFYYPGGLFDLCTLLTHGNTPQGSDIYINNFIQTMHRLNDYNYIWYGSYKKMFGDKIIKMTNEFISKISERRDGSNSFHNIKTRFSLIKALAQLLYHVVYKKRVIQYGIKYIKDGNPVYFSMPTEQELFEAVRIFTSSYFALFHEKDSIINVYDHLIWPQQVNEYGKCFDDSLKIIVVNRDPRDVFLSSKYIWCKPGIGNSVGKPHFGDNAVEFAEEWKKTVVIENINPNSLHINFEDLVYNYEETVSQIELFLGLDKSRHIQLKLKFDPQKSIENTQVFNANKEWYDEVKNLESMLSSYLYHFPFKHDSCVNKMFDSPND